jgi:hypothetical protein
MLGIFKKLWKTEETNVVTVPSPSPFAKPAAQPGARPSPQRSAATPRPAAAPSVSVTTKASPVPVPTIPGSVTITLGSIEPSLPEPLRHKIANALHELVPVPINKVVPQLHRGAVSLTVKELRECAPELLASFQGHDEIPVSLPLADVVRQIEPKLLPRRGSQKRVDVPKEVSEIFTQTSDGLTVLAKHSAPTTASPVASASRPKVPAPTASVAPAVAPFPAPTPAEPVAAPKPEKISLSPQALAALAAAAPAKKTAAAAKAPAIAIPTPAAAAPIPAPSLPKIPAAAAKKPLATPAATTASSPKPSAVSPGTSAKDQATLAVPLPKLVPFLPPEICKELGDVDVEGSSTAVPMSQLEEMLKSGKVLFTWGELSGWLTPPLPRPPSQSASTLLIELPLKVMAPIFMAQHRAGSQKKADVGEGIPDLFQSGNGAEAAAPAVAPAAAAPVEAAPKAPTAARTVAPPAPAKLASAAATAKTSPAKKAAKSVEPAQPAFPSIETLLGTASGKYSPKEIVQNVAKLPGMAGALLAMADGLPVAGVMPQNVKADTLAAFLPQMFGRMTQYTKELGLGGLQSMTLDVEGGCWQVFKQPNIYFAVCGKPGEQMPFNLLVQIAAELNKETK